MNPLYLIEIAIQVPATTQGGTPTLRWRMLPAAGLMVDQGPDGKAVVLMPVGNALNSFQSYPTWETYDAVANRYASITPSQPTVRASAPDRSTAVSAQSSTADQAQTQQQQH